MVWQLAVAKDKLTVANDHISDLQHANKSLSNETAALKDAAEKSANLLAVRTERFVEFRVRKEDEVKRVKARAESRILLLEKQPEIAISKVNAEKYRLERDHMKETVRFQNNIDSLGRQRSK
jgi:hypothetical protein